MKQKTKTISLTLLRELTIWRKRFSKRFKLSLLSNFPILKVKLTSKFYIKKKMKLTEYTANILKTNY